MAKLKNNYTADIVTGTEKNQYYDDKLPNWNKPDDNSFKM